MSDAIHDKYALFLFQEYVPCGGIKDLGMIGSLDECVACAEQSDYSYVSHIVLLPGLDVVKEGEWQYETDGSEQISRWFYSWRDGSDLMELRG